jgi:hypothetical protein
MDDGQHNYSSVPFEARYLAFLETIAQLRPRLHRYCSRMTGSVMDGEDVVQDALFEAYRKLDHMTRGAIGIAASASSPEKRRWSAASLPVPSERDAQRFFAANRFFWLRLIFLRVSADMVRFGFAFFSAWYFAQRRFVASIIRRRPAADIVLRGFDGSTVRFLRLLAPLSAPMAARTAFRRLSSFDASSCNAAMMFMCLLVRSWIQESLTYKIKIHPPSISDSGFFALINTFKSVSGTKARALGSLFTYLK